MAFTWWWTTPSAAFRRSKRGCAPRVCPLMTSFGSRPLLRTCSFPPFRHREPGVWSEQERPLGGGRRLGETLRRLHRRGPHQSGNLARRDFRLSGPERRRQVHHHPHAVRAAAAHSRASHRGRLRRRPPAGGGATEHRLHVAEIFPLHPPARPREPAAVCRAL